VCALGPDCARQVLPGVRYQANIKFGQRRTTVSVAVHGSLYRGPQPRKLSCCCAPVRSFISTTKALVLLLCASRGARTATPRSAVPVAVPGPILWCWLSLRQAPWLCAHSLARSFVSGRVSHPDIHSYKNLLCVYVSYDKYLTLLQAYTFQPCSLVYVQATQVVLRALTE